jgi:hypothetical protein
LTGNVDGKSLFANHIFGEGIDSYRNIEIYRFDDQTGVVFIFASEELQIIVPANGQWRFLNATEL